MASPKVWTLNQYIGPASKEAVIDKLKEIGAPMLRDDVPWEDRLGEVIATTEG